MNLWWRHCNLFALISGRASNNFFAIGVKPRGSHRCSYVIGENYIYMSPFFLLCRLSDTIVWVSCPARWHPPGVWQLCLRWAERGRGGGLLRVSTPAMLLLSGVSVVLVPGRQANKVLTRGGGQEWGCRVKWCIKVFNFMKPQENTFRPAYLSFYRGLHEKIFRVFFSYRERSEEAVVHKATSSEWNNCCYQI